MCSRRGRCRCLYFRGRCLSKRRGRVCSEAERRGSCGHGAHRLGGRAQRHSRRESSRQAEPPPLPGQPEHPHHAALAVTRPAGADPAVDATSPPAVPAAQSAQLAAQLQCQVGPAGGPLPARLLGWLVPPTHVPPFLCCSSGPAPSPSSFLPSPSPQPSQSPVTARTPQNFSVPSPGPLNTPGKLDLGWVRPRPRLQWGE